MQPSNHPAQSGESPTRKLTEVFWGHQWSSMGARARSYATSSMSEALSKSGFSLVSASLAAPSEAAPAGGVGDAFRQALYELADQRPDRTRFGEEPTWDVDVFEVERRAALILAAVPQPVPASREAGERETIARIIDPDAWASHDQMVKTEKPFHGPWTKRSLAKADAILALPILAATPQPEPETGGGDLRREAAFLLDRLRDFVGEHVEDDSTTEALNDWMGHVAPSIARMHMLLDAPTPSAPLTAATRGDLETLRKLIDDLVEWSNEHGVAVQMEYVAAQEKAAKNRDAAIKKLIDFFSSRPVGQGLDGPRLLP